MNLNDSLNECSFLELNQDVMMIENGQFLILSSNHEWVSYAYSINQGNLTYKQEGGSGMIYYVYAIYNFVLYYTTDV